LKRAGSTSVATGLFLLSVLLASSGAEENWPQFRGSGGSAVASSKSPPTGWSREENVSWVREIPGRGWSSPIVWGKTVFLTSAISTDGAFKEPSKGIFGNDYAEELVAQGLSEEEVLARVVSRDIELSKETESIRYMVYAIDAETGALLWERVAHEGKPFGGRHRKNTYASETPATDGERLYVYFGNVGLFAYSLDGELEWEHRFSPRPIYLDFGTAASPAVDSERVYVQSDNQEESFLAAVDKRTGKELWKIARGVGNEGMIRSGWSTPFVWVTPRRSEIVALGHGLAIGYDVDGKELWRLSGLTGQATPTAIAGDGLLYVGTGSQGESNRPMFAIRPGASGDISLSEGSESNEFVAWHNAQASAYTSSPLSDGGRIYVVNDNGILTVLDARKGERLYRARVGGGGFTFSSSPWAYGGYVFFLSEDGETFVAKDGAAYEEVGRNPLEEMTLASPAVAGDSLYIRTQTKLYRLSEGPTTIGR
jgi:outer membrane protein assembly factor BamB